MTRWSPQPAHVRVLGRCEQVGDCWVWTGPVNRKGYGSVMCSDKRTRPVHRVVYEAMLGPIPEGLTLDHECRVKRCVNPWHLDPCPSAVNTARSAPRATRRYQCPQGHDKEQGPTGRWRCKECDRVQSREYQRRRRAI